MEWDTACRLPYMTAGLQAGRTFTEDLVGEDYVEVQVGAEQQPQSAAVGSTKQQQQQQARQGTLQKKADRGQSTLTFMAYDKAVLAQLPEFVQQQLPFMTTAKGALELQLLEFISSLAVSNVSFANITNRLQELAHTHFHKRQLTYYSFAKEAEAAAVAARGEGHDCVAPQHLQECGVQRQSLQNLNTAFHSALLDDPVC